MATLRLSLRPALNTIHAVKVGEVAYHDLPGMSERHRALLSRGDLRVQQLQLSKHCFQLASKRRVGKDNRCRRTARVPGLCHTTSRLFPSSEMKAERLIQSLVRYPKSVGWKAWDRR